MEKLTEVLKHYGVNGKIADISEGAARYINRI